MAMPVILRNSESQRQARRISTLSMLALLALMPLFIWASEASDSASSELPRDAWQQLENGAELKLYQSSFSMFPHPLRASGHNYDGVHYPADIHYRDSSVAVYLPSGFDPAQSYDLLIYFHGWGSNIARSTVKFDLLGQVEYSGRNCIFIFPEGPREAPDSFGGRLEEAGTFDDLISALTDSLKREGKISSPHRSIILAGHSGAYRVISRILDRGGRSSEISQVLLFDALYAAEELYLNWLKTGNRRLVNVVTPQGGTLDNSLAFEQMMTEADIPHSSVEIDGAADLGHLDSSPAVLTLYTRLSHNEVVNPFLRFFLREN